jgi:hypothetical protein
MLDYNPPQSNTQITRRFVVPVTNLEIDLTVIVRRVWELANATGASVQFIGLCDDVAQELSLRRTLATMSAIVNNGNVSSGSEIVFGKDWVNSVKSRLQAGDTVVCWRKQYSRLMLSDLNVPIYFIPESYPLNGPRSHWPAQAAAWLGFAAIIIFFFFLQVEIDRFIKSWSTVWQILSVVGEFGLIWFWNNLFS